MPQANRLWSGPFDGIRTGSGDSPRQIDLRTPRQCPILTGSPSPRARTVNAKRWVQSAQAESRLGEESKSLRADGQCKAMGPERPGSVPF
jgi:hypothetical protein